MVYEDRVPSEMEKKAMEAIGQTFGPEVVDSSILVTFPYEYPHRRIVMEHITEEFTCLCPFSGLPDHAKIIIRYVPNKVCIELKSLKYYLFSYRQVKIFHEHVVNKILEDLVKVLDPIELEVIGEFYIRGGIFTRATAKYKKES
jgi:7-cyano-7-deazaguanine reductase